MIEPIYETESTTHYEFRGGRWWECVQPYCDSTHHYYMAAPDHP